EAREGHQEQPPHRAARDRPQLVSRRPLPIIYRVLPGPWRVVGEAAPPLSLGGSIWGWEPFLPDPWRTILMLTWFKELLWDKTVARGMLMFGITWMGAYLSTPVGRPNWERVMQALVLATGVGVAATMGGKQQ